MQAIFIGQSALYVCLHVWRAESKSLIALEKHSTTNPLYRSIHLFADPFYSASLENNKKHCQFCVTFVEQFSIWFVICCWQSTYQNVWLTLWGQLILPCSDKANQSNQHEPLSCIPISLGKKYSLCNGKNEYTNCPCSLEQNMWTVQGKTTMGWLIMSLVLFLALSNSRKLRKIPFSLASLHT